MTSPIWNLEIPYKMQIQRKCYFSFIIWMSLTKLCKPSETALRQLFNRQLFWICVLSSNGKMAPNSAVSYEFLFSEWRIAFNFHNCDFDDVICKAQMLGTFCVHFAGYVAGTCRFVFFRTCHFPCLPNASFGLFFMWLKPHFWSWVLLGQMKFETVTFWASIRSLTD